MSCKKDIFFSRDSSITNSPYQSGSKQGKHKIVGSVIIFFLLFIFTAFNVFAQEDIIKIERSLEKPIFIQKIKVLYSDSLNLESKEWKNVPLGVKPEESVNWNEGIAWLLVDIEIIDSLGSNNELTLNLMNIGMANEVYWNNKLIGKKGIFRNTDRDHDALEFQVLKVPYDYSTKGCHQLLIKTYNVKDNRNNFYSSIEIGFNVFFIGRDIQQNYEVVIFVSILSAFAIFNIILFFGFNQSIVYLLFSLFCLANAVKAYMSPFWMVESFGVSLVFKNTNICDIMFTVANFALLAYLLIKLSFYKKHKVLSLVFLLSPLSILIVGERFSLPIVIFFAFIPVVFALFKKQEGSLLVLIGLAGFGLITFLRYIGIFGQGYFAGIIFFAICISILSAKEIANELRKRREAVLRTARLENELLKRNIQPHFILNTLTALQEVVEQNPDKASKLIHALADEFRLFSKVSGEKLISIMDELRICEAHLRIMEYRKGAKFQLTTEGITGKEKIPPGIFHTLIENGTTHGYSNKKHGHFSIKKEYIDDCIRYTVFNDSNNEEMQEKGNNGTGIKYVEARLEESFQGVWKLSSQQIENGWQVVIDICENKGNSK